MKYQVLLYYQYAKVADLTGFRKAQYDLCVQLNLRGRIIVAHEGINGTVSGSEESCKAYIQQLRSVTGFEHIVFKIDESDAMAFQKITVREKEELVNLGFPEINPSEKTATHLAPSDFKEMMHQEDVVVLDVRSNYEHKLGKFKNAITLDIEYFRQFPEHLSELEALKSKKVLAYCTGGIRCEKATALLMNNGFEQVFQLDGGIAEYGKQVGGEDFEGSLYVFDSRVAVEINTVNPKVIAHCYVCNSPTNRMVNCANEECNVHTTICLDCGVKLQGACSPSCSEHPQKRPYRESGFYPRILNGYRP